MPDEQAGITKKTETYEPLANTKKIGQQDYDNRENLIRDWIYDISSGDLIEVWHYDSEGKVQQVDYYSGHKTETWFYVDSVIVKREYYDLLGDLIELHEIFSDAKKIVYRVDIYDADNVLKAQEFYNLGGTLFEYHVLTWQASVVIRRDIFDEDKVTQIKYRLFTYDGSNRLLEMREYIMTDVMIVKEQYFVDTGKIYRRWIFCADGLELFWEFIVVGDDTRLYLTLSVTYNNDIQFVEEKNVSMVTAIEERSKNAGIVNSDGLYPLAKTTVFAYDEDDLSRPVRGDVFDADNTIIEQRIFVYDKNKKLVQVVVFFVDGRTKVIEKYTNEVLSSIVEYQYRADSTLEQVTEKVKPSDFFMLVLRYDVHENLVEALKYRDNKMIERKIIAYIVIDSNYVLSWSELYQSTYDVSDTQIEELVQRDEYNSNGFIVKRSFYAGNIVVREKVYEYWDQTVDSVVRDNLQKMFDLAYSEFVSDAFPETVLGRYLAEELRDRLDGRDTDAEIEAALINLASRLGIDLPLSPAMMQEKSVVDAALDTVKEDSETLLEEESADVIATVENSDVPELSPEEFLEQKAEVQNLFVSKVWLDYEQKWYGPQGVRETMEKTFRWPKPPKEPDMWYPCEFFGEVAFLDDIGLVLQSFQAALDGVFTILKTANSVLAIAMQLLSKKFTILVDIVNKFVENVKQMLNQIGGSGAHLMFQLPKKRTVGELFIALERSLTVTTFDEKRFMPNYGRTDNVCGYAFLFVTPHFDELLSAFIDFGKLFRFLQDDLNDSLALTADVRFLLNTWQSGKGFTRARLTWSAYSFSHEVSVSVVTPDAENPIVDETVRNVVNDNVPGGEDNSEKTDLKDQIRSLDFDIEAGKTYYCQVTIKKAVGTGNGINGYRAFKTAKTVLEVPSRKTELQVVLENVGVATASDSDDSKIDGVIMEDRWFSASLDALFPDFFAVKKYIVNLVTKLQNMIKFGTDPTEKTLQAFDRFASGWKKQVDTVMRQIDRIIDMWEINVRDIAYYKKIPPGVGGNNRFVQVVSSTLGIPKEMLGANVYTAAFFLCIGNPTLDGALDTWQMFEKFMLLEDPGDRQEVQRLYEDAIAVTDIKPTFSDEFAKVGQRAREIGWSQ